MKTDPLIRISQSFLASLALALSTPVLAQDSAITPPPAEPAAPALAPAPEDVADAAPVRPRKKEVRIERRGPGKTVHVEERQENDEFDDSADEAPFRKKFDGFAGGGQKRVFRFAPGPDGDVVLRKFGGPGGPMLAARAEAEGALDHLQQAVRHLHAAGLHDLAERAQARAEQMRVRTKADGEMREQFEQLKREHENLKKEMKKLEKLARREEGEIAGKKAE
jgi:hypothetical protein